MQAKADSLSIEKIFRDLVKVGEEVMIAVKSPEGYWVPRYSGVLEQRVVQPNLEPGTASSAGPLFVEKP